MIMEMIIMTISIRFYLGGNLPPLNIKTTIRLIVMPGTH